MCRLTRALAAGKHNLSFNHDVIGMHIIGVTIVAKNDNCDSTDIAGSTSGILLLLLTTIAILLSETFMLVSH